MRRGIFQFSQTKWAFLEYKVSILPPKNFRERGTIRPLFALGEVGYNFWALLERRPVKGGDCSRPNLGYDYRTHWAKKSEKKCNLGMLHCLHQKLCLYDTLFISSTLLYPLTIEQFLMHLYSMCESLCSALVSTIAL